MSKCGKYSNDSMQQKQCLLRNEYSCDGKWEVPVIHRQLFFPKNIQLIACDHICIKAKAEDVSKGVHFFAEDYKLDRYYAHPKQYIQRLAQYAFVLTPDFSLYPEMPIAVQAFNVFRNRWCGAMWQEYGLLVVPTIGWDSSKSFDFCFDGVEEGTIVAISTLGALKRKQLFMEGYTEMKRHIRPSNIICLGKAFPEIENDVICVDYKKTTRRNK
ncbi:MAG: DUF4417 domain-containing protein [Bacteroidia bacterium]|nr:DUF4417 domain-containing protein [Bacteroidia bacterium]